MCIVFGVNKISRVKNNEPLIQTELTNKTRNLVVEWQVQALMKLEGISVFNMTLE